MVIHSSGLKLLNLSEDSYSVIVVEISMVVCFSFLKVLRYVIAYRSSMRSISHKVHFHSRKTWFFVF